MFSGALRVDVRNAEVWETITLELTFGNIYLALLFTLGKQTNAKQHWRDQLTQQSANNNEKL